jgi:23S rRNA (guanine745-N1)-methyltransferase
MNHTDFLVCPICGQKLELQERSLLCLGNEKGKRHCFDLSSSGYCDLSYRNGGAGDPKDAVTDRTAFLDKGYYSPLATEINRLCEKYLGKEFFLVDAGCGEGYYSEHIASEFPSSYVFGADLSKHAVHRASVRRNLRAGKNSFYSVSSIFRLPVAGGSSDCVLSMFAPISEDETLRVLKPGGVLIIGAAGVGHLYELKSSIYESVTLNEERADLPRSMRLVDKVNVNFMMDLDCREDIQRLFGMTPYRFRTSQASLQLLNELNSLKVRADVDFYIFQK